MGVGGQWLLLAVPDVVAENVDPPAHLSTAFARRPAALVGAGARGGREDGDAGPAVDRKSTRLNSSHSGESRMPSSA